MQGRGIVTAIFCIVLAISDFSLIPGSVPDTALAHDHKPPTVTLSNSNRHQGGRLLGYCWSGEFLGGTCQENRYSLPHRIPVDVENRTGILVSKRQPPHEFEVTARSRSRGNGRRLSLRASLSPEFTSSGLSWFVDIDVSSLRSDHVVRLYARWLDEDGNPFAEEATWLFHVDART